MVTALDERRVRALAFGRGVDGLQLEKAAAALKRMRQLGLEKRDLIDIIGQLGYLEPDDCELLRRQASMTPGELEADAARAKAAARAEQAAAAAAPIPLDPPTVEPDEDSEDEGPDLGAIPVDDEPLPSSERRPITDVVVVDDSPPPPPPPNGPADDLSLPPQQRWDRRRAYDERIAKLARNLADPAAIDEALSVQESTWTSQQLLIPLAQLLVEREVLTSEEAGWVDRAIASAQPPEPAAEADAAPIPLTSPLLIGDGAAEAATPPDAPEAPAEPEAPAAEAEPEVGLAPDPAPREEPAVTSDSQVSEIAKRPDGKPLEIRPYRPDSKTDPKPAARRDEPASLDETTPRQQSEVELDRKLAQQDAADAATEAEAERPPTAPPSRLETPEEARDEGEPRLPTAPPSKLSTPEEARGDGDAPPSGLDTKKRRRVEALEELVPPPPIEELGRRRRRILPTKRQLAIGGLVVLAILLTAGLQQVVTRLAAAADDDAWRQASQMAEKDHERGLEMIEAYRKKYPRGRHAEEAKTELQRLHLDHAIINFEGGLEQRERAKELFRLVRQISTETGPAAEALNYLDQIAELEKREARAAAWKVYIDEVSALQQGGDPQAVIDRLGRPPFARLTEAEAAERDQLRAAALAEQTRRLLSTFVYLPGSKLKLPDGPAASKPADYPRPVRRYRLESVDAIRADGPQAKPVGPAGTLVVHAGPALVGVDARSGAMRWRQAADDDPAFDPLPVSLGERVGRQIELPDAALVPRGERTLALVDAANGRERWTRTLPAALRGRPTLTGAGGALVGAADGRAYLIELGDGRVKGAFVTGGEIVSAPTYAPDTDLLVVPSADSFCYLFSLEERRFLGRLPAPPHPGVSPMLVGEVLFVPHRSGNRTELVAHQLDLSGERLASRKLDTFLLDGRLRTDARVIGGQVFLVTDTGQLGVYAVDPDDEQQPVYALTKQRSGRSILQKGSVRLLDRKLGRQVMVIGDDLHLYDLPEIGDNVRDQPFAVKLSWRQEDTSRRDTPIHGFVSGTPWRSRGWLCFATRQPRTAGVHLYAFDLAAEDPELIWHRTLAAGVRDRALWLGKETDGPEHGRLLIAKEDGGLHSLSFDGGAPIHRRLRRGTAQLPFTGMAADADHLYVARGREVSRLDRVTGEPLPGWKLDVALKGDVVCGPVLADGMLLIGTQRGAIYGINPRSGRLAADEWTAVGRAPLTTQPVVWKQLIVVGTATQGLYGLKPTTAGMRTFLSQEWQLRTDGAVRCQPWLSGKMLWAGADDGKVYRLDLEKPTVPLVGATQLPASVRGALVGGELADGSQLVLATTVDGGLYALDGADGKVRWKVPPAGAERLDAAPALVGDVVYVISTRGELRSYGATDGKPGWSLRLPDRFHADTLRVIDGRLWVLSRRGFLYEVALP